MKKEEEEKKKEKEEKKASNSYTEGIVMAWDGLEGTCVELHAFRPACNP